MKRQVRQGLGMTAAGATLALGALFVLQGAASATHQDKLTICHATSSETHPYTVQTIDTSAIDEHNNAGWNGHGDHTRDIIPPFGHFPGRNYDAAGTAILANGCHIPTPPVTTPPATDPPATDPPVTEPPTTLPPTTLPPTTLPPTTLPPATTTTLAGP